MPTGRKPHGHLGGLDEEVLVEEHRQPDGGVGQLGHRHVPLRAGAEHLGGVRQPLVNEFQLLPGAAEERLGGLADKGGVSAAEVGATRADGDANLDDSVGAPELVPPPGRHVEDHLRLPDVGWKAAGRARARVQGDAQVALGPQQQPLEGGPLGDGAAGLAAGHRDAPTVRGAGV
eukprot:TRINITY_DN18225_c0_g1_i1.p1 TRINITY_DN18225_c0_g1~~TRINITY_DN18225_c0_g1_i1.p1  ORF type:complete len:175 (+),score=10.52 TRINITY_DN18225_c0_g1_i1:131-655(+)